MSSGQQPSAPGGRGSEEREAARREREARRAARSGTAAPRAPAEPSDDPPSTEGWLERARHLTTGDGDGAEPSSPRGSRGASISRFVPVGILAGLLALVAWFLLSLFQPFHGDGGEKVGVRISQGAALEQIGDLLEEKEVISSGFFFGLRARLGGRSGSLKPGSYGLEKGMSHASALDALAQGPPPDVVTVTIPEGRSRREVARSVPDGLAGDYLAASRRSRLLDPRKYGGRRARDLEGFLFPATYELKRGQPVRALVEQQLSAFRQRFGGVDLRFSRSRNLTPYDVLTIASMVEREAQLPKERPVIASVIYNRLREGMPLGIDATVRFATGNWTRPLRQSELRLDSPYNTRMREGLPPGPIGSPGLASIEAAARPKRTKFLFYVVKPGGRGAHAFSATDAEFQRDVARYNRERARRGGRSPAAP